MSLSAPGQFDRAKEAALRAVDAAPASHAIALVSFADAAAVAVEPTTDRSAARRGDREAGSRAERHALSHRAVARQRSDRRARRPAS